MSNLPTPTPTDEIVITVDSYFGERTLNKGEFVAQWVDHIRQCAHLVSSAEDLEEYDRMKDALSAMASRRFDYLARRQGGQQS